MCRPAFLFYGCFKNVLDVSVILVAFNKSCMVLDYVELLLSFGCPGWVFIHVWLTSFNMRSAAAGGKQEFRHLVVLISHEDFFQLWWWMLLTLNQHSYLFMWTFSP